MSEVTLWVQSGVNKGGEPFVQLFKNDDIIVQLTVQQVREHAAYLVECAEAAEQDAFIIDFAKTILQMNEETAARILIAFRKYRDETTGKKGGPSSKSDFVITDKHQKS